jgi:hypothetical protein
MSIKNLRKIEKIRIFWEKYEKKIVLGLGILLVAVISFEIGVLQGHKLEQKTLVIEKAPEINTVLEKNKKAEVLGVQSNLTENKDIKKEIAGVTNNQECIFVGSKNSDKYHKSDCRWAKNIKPENLVCFMSEDEAKNKGYVGDKGCIK